MLYAAFPATFHVGQLRGPAPWASLRGPAPWASSVGQLRTVTVCPRRCLSASVAFGAGASERPQVPRASGWPVPRASQSGTLQARLLGATALGFRRHSLTVQASEQTGLDALRRMPGGKEGEGESDAASAGGERARRLCGVLFTPL